MIFVKMALGQLFRESVGAIARKSVAFIALLKYGKISLISKR
ncbi:Hypothetical protein ADU72_2013 [Pediococcus damnosus]|uniref:Uncharacterized protein n=1 Tax=Pediococcus damnosus TaxID=51663 RepID=A0AAC9B0N0_9LACO|nr:Hypothetical protein ADU70_0711 [Pediococcus damnosus]AMV67934.1 Hypothetical protein ADU72_2013 [Pediococcus damnosus]AMV70132.1 Hypothetical protein ADU73_1744 [Pediococcus damnosus]